MKSIKNILVIILCASTSLVFAHKNPESTSNITKPTVETEDSQEVSLREDCQAASSQIDMDINNVRARLLTGGDVWWDLQNGRYIVPKVAPGEPAVSSLYAGGVWIGGEDPAGNLKIAASTYRSGGGVDYFAGPLDPETGLTDLPICNDWDRFFVVDGTDLSKAIQLYDQFLVDGIPVQCDSIPDNVRFWPGKDNPYFQEKFPFALPQGQNLGSYWDEDLSGDYDPCRGDFPIIDIRGCEPGSRKEAVELVPDQMIFWIYNDAGGEHRLTRGEKIQMEVQVQAFAYATNDEVNDMTFQRYKLLNRADEDIRNCYFAMWVDPDLGCATDDFVGCDPSRSLAYTYNEDLLDGTSGCDCGETNTYCDRVPIIGTDYFRGPIGPYTIVDCSIGETHIVAAADDIEGSGLSVGDTICVLPVDLGSSETANLGIELGMSSFVYYNNAGIGGPDPNTVDPQIDFQYYNYLRGLWLDGTPVTFGGTGLNPGSVETIPYAFPDDPNDPDGWNMCNVDLGNGDRRTLQASGPLLLKPSVENELIIGAVWVPDLSYPCPDISRLKRADDLAQALFDNCFDIIDGPTAPDVCPIALDREIILVLSNDSIASNNAFEGYFERDILAATEIPDSIAQYEFEGYLIYQLANAGVTPQELDDIEKARIIRQVDVRNNISEIYNWTSVVNPDPNSGDLIYFPTRKVDGADAGISHTFRILEDAYASEDSRLVNHREYYYMVLAYAHNSYETFDPVDELGQATPYLEGRKNIKTYTIVPRPIVYTKQNASYGDGAVITRVSGVGVGGNFLDMDSTMYDKILAGGFDGRITYKEGAGPISVKIYDPINVQDGNFTLEFIDNDPASADCKLNSEAIWRLTNEDNGQVIEAEQSIANLNEQLIPAYGFSLEIGQSAEPGDNIGNNGAIDIVSEYSDPSAQRWYSGIIDDGQGLELPPQVAPIVNFMRTGSGEQYNSLDVGSNFASLGERTWYPFFLTDGRNEDNLPFYLTPAWEPQQDFLREFVDKTLSVLNNVDIVFTSDKSKWSRCIVVETASPLYGNFGHTTQGEVSNMDLRDAASVDKNGNPESSGKGKSWFPGFAVDVETGKRLNIFFGENSIYGDQFTDFIDGGNPIGADMMFNPTSQLFADIPTANFADPIPALAGGQHVIYLTRDEYDECEGIRNELAGGSVVSKLNAFSTLTWTSMSLLPTGASMLSYEDNAIPNDLVVKLRVDNGYGKESVFSFDSPGACNLTGNNPKYEFEINGKESVPVDESGANEALDMVNVVPNPYYGFSQYESSQIEKVVKITNLPDDATVTIFSLDGKFIRQFKRSERVSNKSGSNPGTTRTQTFPDLEWDLNNSTGIPVASGVYLIHVAAPSLNAEKTIKWFGVNRKFDASGL